MKDEDLINEINSKIIEIYKSNSLIPLRGEYDSYKLNGKPILTWYNEITRHCWCNFNAHFNYNKNIDELLYSSDEIIYFTAHLYFYKPYINTPLKDSYWTGKTTIYPVFSNLPGKRYDMFVGVCFEKVYNYWDRIGDLIASFYPNRFKGNIYFSKTIKKLESEYRGNKDYDWLRNFVDNEFTDFNQERIDVVHYISKSTQQKWNQLGHVTDYNKSKALTDKILSYPEYFKQMNEICKIGFEKTLNLLEEINKRENYDCENK